MDQKNVSLIDGQRGYKATIILLAWPIFLEMLLVSLVQAVDTAMVGSLGATATASVAINSATNVLINGVMIALGVGFTSLIARSVGAGNMEKAWSLTRQSILMVLLFCLPMSILYYALGKQIPVWMGGEPEILRDAEIYNKVIALSLLFRGFTMVLTAIYRGYGNSKTPMKINVMVNLLNVVGNFLMIYPTRELTVFGRTFTMFGFGWGVAGAAVSTSISTVLGGLILLILCFTSKTEPHISLKGDFRLHKNDMAAVLQISVPAMMERFIMGTAFIVVGRAVATLGTAAVAAQNLTGTAESLCFMPAIAFGNATTTLFGQALGARRPDMAHRYVVETIKIATVVMAVMSVGLFLGSEHVMHLFTPDAEVIELGKVLLKILALIQIPQMIGMVYSGALKGAGDAKSPFVVALISMWGVRILGTVVCIHLLHMGLVSACVSMCTDNVVRCLLFHFCYKRGAWKKAHALED